MAASPAINDGHNAQSHILQVEKSDEDHVSAQALLAKVQGQQVHREPVSSLSASSFDLVQAKRCQLWASCTGPLRCKAQQQAQEQEQVPVQGQKVLMQTLEPLVSGAPLPSQPQLHSQVQLQLQPQEPLLSDDPLPLAW
jgi:hypothetical protein